MAKKQIIRRWGYGVGCFTSMLACGPLPDVSDGEGHSDTADTDVASSGTADTDTAISEGGAPAGSGGGPIMEPGAGGGYSSCQNTAPPQTYLCAGSWYESELAGAAALQLYTLPADYACQEEPYYGSGGYGTGGAGYGGYYGAGGAGYGGYYGAGGGYYAAGGADGDTSGGYYGGDGDTSGGYYGGDGDTSGGYYGGDGDTSGGYYGGDGDTSGGYYGGDGDTSGGYYYGSGGSGSGGALPASGGSTNSGNLRSDWCADRDPYELVAGASFAVRPCQLTDLALPIKFTEPSYGGYEVFVYGGSNPCERGILLATTAGLGTGLTISVPVDTTGVDFVSIEMVTDNNWSSAGLRLVDRPAVGDNGK